MLLYGCPPSPCMPRKMGRPTGAARLLLMGAVHQSPPVRRRAVCFMLWGCNPIYLNLSGFLVHRRRARLRRNTLGDIQAWLYSQRGPSLPPSVAACRHILPDIVHLTYLGCAGGLLHTPEGAGMFAFLRRPSAPAEIGHQVS